MVQMPYCYEEGTKNGAFYSWPIEISIGVFRHKKRRLI